MRAALKSSPSSFTNGNKMLFLLVDCGVVQVSGRFLGLHEEMKFPENWVIIA